MLLCYCTRTCKRNIDFFLKSITDSFLHQWSMWCCSAANNIVSASEFNEPWVTQTSDHSPCRCSKGGVCVCCHANRCPDLGPGIFFYRDNYKDEEDDEQLQNMINGIVSIHIQWRLSLVFHAGWTAPGKMHSCYFVPLVPLFEHCSDQVWS